MAQTREAPRGPRGFLVDTNVLVSKKLRALRGLPGPLYVTPVVVLEYMNWAIASRNRMLAKGMHERAKGYERLIGLLPSLLEALGVELIDQASMPRTNDGGLAHAGAPGGLPPRLVQLNPGVSDYAAWAA